MTTDHNRGNMLLSEREGWRYNEAMGCYYRQGQTRDELDYHTNLQRLWPVAEVVRNTCRRAATDERENTVGSQHKILELYGAYTEIERANSSFDIETLWQAVVSAAEVLKRLGI